MARRKIPRRLVIFLGAGASAPYGYPLTTTLLSRIWDGLRRPDGPGGWKRWAGMKHGAKLRHGDARRLETLLKALLPGLETRTKLDSGVSIVDVISLLDQMLAEGRSPHIDISVRELLAARQVLNKAINGVLQGRCKRKYAERLSSWILRVATEHRGSRVSVVSTNYDTTTERPLFKYLIQHGVSIGKVVDLGMPWRDASRSWIHVRPGQARLAFLKLHGSLNWLRCELCGHITMNVSQRIASLDNWETRSPREYNVCWCGGLLRGILVTPSVVRDVRDANLLGIWVAALEYLRFADEWIFVGYSLPTEDIAIRSLLLRAWHARRRKNLRVRVIQFEDLKAAVPSEAYKRYRLFFPSFALKETNYRRDGLEAFVDGLDAPSKSKLHARIRQTFGGRTSSEMLRREKQRKLIESERNRAQRTRR